MRILSKRLHHRSGKTVACQRLRHDAKGTDVHAVENRILLSQGHWMNVVVADQDPHTRARLKRRLQKIRGIVVIGEASESDEARAMIANRKPDLVILDTELTNGSGIEVLRHIKHLVFHPTVIMVTNRPSQDLRSACAVAGADFFFDKSLEDRKVVETVRLLCVSGLDHDVSDTAESLPD